MSVATIFARLLWVLLNYHSTFNELPIGIETDEGGTPIRSWRTYIFPNFMESSRELYDPTTPWDSKVNRKLFDGSLVNVPRRDGTKNLVVLNPCFDAWRCRSCDSTSRRGVNYAVVIGQETAFPKNRAVKFDEITDGLENTILVVETLSGSKYWTEPRDLLFSKMEFKVDRKNNGEIASLHSGGVFVGFADGQVYFMSDSISADDLSALLTISGGENVTRKDLVSRGFLSQDAANSR